MEITIHQYTIHQNHFAIRDGEENTSTGDRLKKHRNIKHEKTVRLSSIGGSVVEKTVRQVYWEPQKLLN